jgi:hypothetical protein
MKSRFLAERHQRRTLHEHLQVRASAKSDTVSLCLSQLVFGYALHYDLQYFIQGSMVLPLGAVQQAAELLHKLQHLYTLFLRASFNWTNQAGRGMLQVLRGNIRVICRIRPSTSDEEPALHVDAEEPGLLTVVDAERQRQKRFEFNDVCTAACTQADIFEVRTAGKQLASATRGCQHLSADRRKHRSRAQSCACMFLLACCAKCSSVPWLHAHRSIAPKRTHCLRATCLRRSVANECQLARVQLVAPMVRSCADGYNTTIFAYGQTGSGAPTSLLRAATCPRLHTSTSSASCPPRQRPGHARCHRCSTGEQVVSSLAWQWPAEGWTPTFLQARRTR